MSPAASGGTAGDGRWDVVVEASPRTLGAWFVAAAERAGRLDCETAAQTRPRWTISGARVYSALLGHVDGVPLVSPDRLAKMAAVTFTGMDEVMGFPRYGPARPNGRSRPGSTFGMVGMNGSAAYADIDSGVAVAVMRNRFTAGDLATVVRIDQAIADELA